jgi:acyl-CoA synthetase (AMP-forming)/AMP-acid ligase II
MFYHGRSDDMSKVSGATVYPSEVEQALRGIAGVGGAFVTNVPSDHGDRVGAAVVCETNSTTAEALCGTARTLLSSFKVPTVWPLLSFDDVPRGSSGKVDIRRLREMLVEAGTLEPAE